MKMFFYKAHGQIFGLIKTKERTGMSISISNQRIVVFLSSLQLSLNPSELSSKNKNKDKPRNEIN